MEQGLLRLDGCHLPEARVKRFVPNISAFIWIAYFLAMVFSQWRLELISADGDPGWHWRQGNWMLEHRDVMRADEFSHTRPGAPVVGKEWLSQVLFAIAGNILGWNGLILVAAVLISTTLWLLHRQLLAEGNELLLSTGLTLLAALTAAHHWLARPHLFTCLFALIFAWQLRWFQRDRISARQLLLRLVPTMLLWVNLHGAWPTGFILIGTYVAGNFATWLFNTISGSAVHCSDGTMASDKSKLMPLLALGGLCAAVTFINPYGWQLHQHILSFLSTPYQTFFTVEWASVDFHLGAMFGFTVELLLLGILLVVVRPRLSLMDILLIGSWTYFGLSTVRNVSIFAMVVTPIFAEHFNPAVLKARWERFRKLSADMTGVHLSAGGGGSVIAVIIVVIALMLTGRPVSEPLRDRFPAEAVKWIRANKPPGEMFNKFEWGGYLMLHLPGQKMFIDSRNDFYGEALLREYSAVDELQPGWDKVLSKYHIGWVLMRSTHPISSLLALQTNDWDCAYRDDVAVVFVRR
jgi:hypothetical protein